MGNFYSSWLPTRTRGKIILLKTPHALVAGHRVSKPNWSGGFLPCSSAQEEAMQTAWAWHGYSTLELTAAMTTYAKQTGE